MIQPFLIALQKHLKEASIAQVIDHWNNQPSVAEKELQALTALYIDFGTIVWTKQANGVKQAKAEIYVHCVGKHIQPTHADAPGTDAQRLNRFKLSQDVLAALDGTTLKDDDGLPVIHRMELASSQMDTNHDALSDDVLTFTCQLYYYDTWVEKNWQEIELQGVDAEYDRTLSIEHANQ